MAASKFDYTTNGYSNSYKLNLSKGTNIYRYQVNILLETASRGHKSFTNNDQKTYGYFEETVAYSLVSSAHDITKGFGVSSNTLQMVYDNRNLLFTNKKIPQEFENIVLDRKQFGQYAEKALKCPSVNITLTYTGNICYDDKKYYKVDNDDRSLLQFLELLAAQSLIDSSHFIKSRNDLFRTSSDVRKLPSGLVMLEGMNKGFSLMKEKGDVKVCVTVDVIYAPFFQESLLLHLIDVFVNKRINSINAADLARFMSVYKNVKVGSSYNGLKCYVLHQLSLRSAADTRFMYDDKEVTVVQYFEQRYNLKLQYPHLQMLEKKGKKFTTYVPLELLTVLPGQRVHMSKYEFVGPRFEQDVTRINLMNAEKRYDMIKTAVNEIQRGSLFKHFGVQLDIDSNKVEIGIRRLPTVPGCSVNKKTGAFRINKYAVPVTINRWIVLYGKGASVQDATRFVSRLREEAQKKNVTVAEVLEVARFNSDSTQVNYWESQFRNFKDKNLDIVFLIDSSNTPSHSHFKLCERRFSVLTQHITVEALKRLRSLENILNKTNEKLNGLCYKITPEPIGSRLSLDSNQFLVFGYDVSHPKQRDLNRDDQFKAKSLGLESLNPSVVGLSYNCAENPCNFIGDYFFQKARKEQVDEGILQEKVIAALKKWRTNRRGVALPGTVFIFRDGISDGQFAMAINEELSAFRGACESLNYAPKFVFIVATKNHRKRFFDQNYRNISISSVIEKGIGRPSVAADWHQQSANPIIGTAKPPNFIVLKNEPDYSEDVLQSFCAYLCYNHQIVSSPISLPEPVQLSHELAKRGGNNLEQWLKSNRMPRDFDGVVDTQALNNNLSYLSTQLSNQRFNA